MDRVAEALLRTAATGESAGAKELRSMVEAGDFGPEMVPGHVEEVQGELFDDRAERAERGAGEWTEADLQVLGERVRDYLRKVAARAVAAFVVGGVERGDAKLYVSEDLAQVARETWTAPKGKGRT